MKKKEEGNYINKNKMNGKEDRTPTVFVCKRKKERKREKKKMNADNKRQNNGTTQNIVMIKIQLEPHAM